MSGPPAVGAGPGIGAASGPAADRSAGPGSGWALRAMSDRVSWRIHPRTLLVSGLLAGLIVLVGGWTLMTGDYQATPGQVVRTLLGDGPPGLETVVNRFRLPRLLIAIGVGAALGVAGGIFQSVSRNPLGSPDIIGFTTGSATGGLLLILLYPHSSIGVPAGAVGGGLLTAVMVYGLSYRRGVQGNRLILIGIGVGAVLASVNAFLLSRATLESAQSAQHWLVGSVNGLGWAYVWPLWAVLAVVLPITLLLGRNLMIMELGEETAGALGVPIERTRLALAVCAVGLTAVATAAAGPIAFVALAAPQIARRLARSGTPTLFPAALTGALILVVADLAGQRLLNPVQLPVGVSTGAIGGLYLTWLLGREWRKGK
ncbi:FecCD family ABC transporter permease [Frankia gtarii]|uniref:FecCD family ABC transporter permease n=1 Tax=Frankia gtarii TaxID=2950102 RepID=UPI0021C05605|nr:iron chelate uptake ABC transporter family permease subunit [Frankia gtarii]